MLHEKADLSSDAQGLLHRIVLDYMQEQKWKRRWIWVRRIITSIILALIASFLIIDTDDNTANKNKPHVGLIDIEGGIFEKSQGSADTLAKGLKEAYKNKQLKALILRINSPGGSPVQADYMYNLIQFYKKKHPDIKVYAVCTDMCASAAYYAASASDAIYANPASLVGSIGVISSGFGFVDLIQKIGISRRVQTAGNNKDILDPFAPEKPEDKVLLQNMLNEIHQQFIDKVKAGRGDRLKIDAATFSGLFWTGTQAKERGLIDDFASSGELARRVLKSGNMVDYTNEDTIFDKVSKNMGASLADHLPEALGLKSRLVM